MVDNHTKLRRICYKTVYPVSARDFVCVSTWRMLRNGCILIAAKWIPDDFFPVKKSHVRGRILVGGYLIDPVRAGDGTLAEPAQCEVTVLAHTDLAGSLPAALVNRMTTQVPVKMLTAICGIVERPGELGSPLVDLSGEFAAIRENQNGSKC